jgi:hypothetical protein
MSLRTLQTAFGLLTVAVTMQAASLASLSAHLFGEVRNSAGVPQMGATVALYNRYDQEVRHVLTNEAGKFVFDGLNADVYSVRVTLASFMPALRRNITVLAGSENLLRINLASVFSTVELMPPAASNGTLMSDDWKWVLRASQATRPVLRFTPVSSASTSKIAPVFTDTTGMVRVSADTSESSPEGGTTFVLSTHMNGNANVHVSGTFGYTTGAGLPAVALGATYARDSGRGPEISLSMRQITAPTLAGSGTAGEGPALRTASLSLRDHVQVTEDFLLEYGMTLDSASYVSKITAVSPFARATYQVGEKSLVRFAASSGTQVAGFSHAQSPFNSGDLNQDLAALNYAPRLSQRSGDLHMERTGRLEAGYEFAQSSRRYAAAVFREEVRNGTAMSVGGRGVFDATEVLRDFDSLNETVNIGSYQRSGYAAGVTQSLGDHVEVSVSGGRGGALVAPSQKLQASQASEIGGWLHKADRTWVTARLSATVPASGTRVATSYGWTDFNSLVPQHYFLTSNLIDQEIGWNLSVRQPLPSCMSGYRGRMEAGAEVRNFLSDGYLYMYSGQTHSLLSSSPRSLRGSLSFIF